MWEDNIVKDLEEIVINMRNWVDSALDRDYLGKCSWIYENNEHKSR